MILIDLDDGRCRRCGSQLQIVGADDVCLTVECTNHDCVDVYTVETDFFNDGGIKYWPLAVAELDHQSEELLLDPNDTWDTLLQAYATKDFESACEHARSLLEWLDRDGFPPRLTIGSTTTALTCQLDEGWNRAVARTACQFILERFQKEDDHVAL